MSRAPLTKEGAERLKSELERLKKKERPAVIQAIAEARAHGDLKENAEYHAAREQQSFIEGRIQELENALSTAQIIDISSLNVGDKVVFGARVVLHDEDEDEEVRWHIVGELEADVSERRISVTSPLARALIGQRQGDVVAVNAPSGVKNFEIVEVAYNQ